MAAPSRRRARRAPASASPPRFLVRLAALALLVAACGSGTVVPTAPPDATSSAAPPETATPAATVTPSPTFPLAIVDDEGTAVEIPAEPQHIVSLTPAATETLFAIGAGDRVAAKVEDIAAYPPEADDLPVVATFEGVDVEQIVKLEADLVIAGGLFFTPVDAIQQLRTLGVPVLVLYAESVDQALSGIQKIGDAAGEAEAAAELVVEMRADFDELEAATAGLDRPVTFYELDATQKIYTVPEGSLYAEMLELAGADPVTTDDSYEISLEELLSADPEVILLGDDAAYTTAADVAARPGWAGITAVREGNVIAIEDFVLVTRPGPRLADGLRALVAALHPEALD